VAKLEAEVGLLKDQLGKAKDVNDMMWETVVQRVMVNAKEKDQERGESGTMEMDEEAVSGCR
jgi:pre-rRNA-processing protein IPI3